VNLWVQVDVGAVPQLTALVFQRLRYLPNSHARQTKPVVTVIRHKAASPLLSALGSFNRIRQVASMRPPHLIHGYVVT